MIQRLGGWPFGPRDDEPEGTEEPELEADDDLFGPPLPVAGGVIVQEPEPEPDRADAPRMDPEVMYDPERSPYKVERDDKGRILPGTTVSPATMFRPGHPHLRDPYGEAKARAYSAPMPDYDIDRSIAARLRERLDAPEPDAVDRLALLARRVVDDALRGRQYAVEVILDRLQPVRPRPKSDSDGAGGIVIVNQVVGPQGPERAPRVYDLRSGFEHDDDED